MTLKEIARLANVAVSTVSRVINQKNTKAASPEVQERIWEIVRKSGYTPNATARSLKLGQKAQIQNKAKAFALLKSKLYDIEQQQRHDAEAEMRRSQIGTGDRSEKIRTYNFPQGRVTDHRIGLTLYKLDKIMNGDIEEIIDACIAADQAAKLAKMNEE